MRQLRDLAGIEGAVGTRPAAIMMKSIDELDVHCQSLLALARFSAIGYRDQQGHERLWGVGGQPGFAQVLDPSQLELHEAGPRPELDTGSRVSSVFLVPGLGETLRINGRVAELGEGRLRLSVEEAFLHCAKCIIRSRLWHGGELTESDHAGPDRQGPASEEGPLGVPGLTELLARSPFVILASRDGTGDPDSSPKGDPPGFVLVLDQQTLVIPDRLGNRRTDTFHNLIEDDRLALLALVPGTSKVVEAWGHAALTDDEELRRSMAVDQRVPKAALVLHVDAAEVRDCHGVAAADLWKPEGHADLSGLPPMAQMFRDHVRMNKQKGLGARVMRSMINEKIMAKILTKDYRDNLY